MWNFQKLSLSLIFLLLFASLAAAQELDLKKSNKNLWFSAVAGSALMGGEPGSGGALALGYAPDKNYFAAEFIAVSQEAFSNIGVASEPIRSFMAGNFYYGRIVRASSFKITYASGISILLADEERRGGDVISRSQEFYLGLPLQVQLIFTPVRVLAIGMEVFANINTYSSAVGVNLGIYFGKID